MRGGGAGGEPGYGQARTNSSARRSGPEQRPREDAGARRDADAGADRRRPRQQAHAEADGPAEQGEPAEDDDGDREHEHGDGHREQRDTGGGDQPDAPPRAADLVLVHDEDGGTRYGQMACATSRFARIDADDDARFYSVGSQGRAPGARRDRSAARGLRGALRSRQARCWTSCRRGGHICRTGWARVVGLGMNAEEMADEPSARRLGHPRSEPGAAPAVPRRVVRRGRVRGECAVPGAPGRRSSPTCVGCSFPAARSSSPSRTGASRRRRSRSGSRPATTTTGGSYASTSSAPGSSTWSTSASRPPTTRCTWSGAAAADPGPGGGT